jgi:hypothetical protein
VFRLGVQSGARILASAKPEKANSDASGATRGDISWSTNFKLQRVGLKEKEKVDGARRKYLWID